MLASPLLGLPSVARNESRQEEMFRTSSCFSCWWSLVREPPQDSGSLRLSSHQDMLRSQPCQFHLLYIVGITYMHVILCCTFSITTIYCMLCFWSVETGTQISSCMTLYAKEKHCTTLAYFNWSSYSVPESHSQEMHIPLWCTRLCEIHFHKQTYWVPHRSVVWDDEPCKEKVHYHHGGGKCLCSQDSDALVKEEFNVLNIQWSSSLPESRTVIRVQKILSSVYSVHARQQ